MVYDIEYDRSKVDLYLCMQIRTQDIGYMKVCWLKKGGIMNLWICF